MHTKFTTNFTTWKVVIGGRILKLQAGPAIDLSDYNGLPLKN